MVWGMFLCSTLRPIIPTQQSLTSVHWVGAMCVNIVVDQVHAFMTKYFLRGLVFTNRIMHYVIRIESPWDHSRNITVASKSCIHLLPSSPNINLIWSYLENQICAARLPARNVRELQNQYECLVPDTSDYLSAPHGVNATPAV